jgi:hypothetical protein
MNNQEINYDKLQKLLPFFETFRDLVHLHFKNLRCKEFRQYDTDNLEHYTGMIKKRIFVNQNI